MAFWGLDASAQPDVAADIHMKQHIPDPVSMTQWMPGSLEKRILFCWCRQQTGQNSPWACLLIRSKGRNYLLALANDQRSSAIPVTKCLASSSVQASTRKAAYYLQAYC
jgi:hypothetical protein